MSIDINKILEEIELLLDIGNDQIILQTVKGCEDPVYGTGRLTSLHHSENEFIIPLYPNLEYTNSVINDLGMCRTRIMRMKEKSCYTYHQDATQRIHIPLITNDNCFMIIEDEIHRYPANGNYYIVDTTKRHTFVNASLEERIHIVGCIKE